MNPSISGVFGNKYPWFAGLELLEIQETVSEGALPATHWLDGCSGLPAPDLLERAEGWSSLEKCEEVKLGVKVVPAPQIHFTQSTPPFLSCIPVSCEKSVFLKTGSSNAWVPEVLPSTLCMGAVVHRAYLFTGEIAILSVGKALGLEAGTRCSGPASQPFTDHFGHSLVLPRPVFLCKSNNPD